MKQSVFLAALFAILASKIAHSFTPPAQFAGTKTQSLQGSQFVQPQLTFMPSPLYASFSTETEEEITTQTRLPAMVQYVVEEEEWVADSKVVELAALGLWMAALSGFILMNNFVGPWPAVMSAVPERIWFTLHMLGGMLFGGGIILTTALEWLVAENKNESVLQFYFDKVPLLDAAIVLPGLTMAMISGVGLTILRYGGLGIAPPHIPVVFYTLTAFAGWWAATDLSTQGSSLKAINEWAATVGSSNEEREVPRIVELRKVSNVVSCLFVVALYMVMVMKPGTLHHL